MPVISLKYRNPVATIAESSRPVYSRSNPSPSHRALLAQYQRMHVEGEPRLGISARKTFAGQSLLPHAPAIRQLIREHGARTVLDYGAGKGWQYRLRDFTLPTGERTASLAAYWGVEIACYDPGVAEFSKPPQGRFDAVVCTDVLEHCPEEDLSWIVDELFGYSRLFLYASVACYPARKRLPNGENAHRTIRLPTWWEVTIRTIAARHPQIRYHVVLERLGRTWLGRRRRTALIVQG